jgi:phytoene dehydrogenase-like protein
MKQLLNRRQAIKIMGGSGLALYLSPKFETPAFESFAWAQGASSSDIASISPINRGMEDISPKIWFSDYPETAHKVLWDKATFLSSLGNRAPKPTERVPLVVIGGGISGLFSAYLLRKHKPVILEQAPRFGGNSKGQSWRGVDYSIGAAYFIKPEDDSDIATISKELGLDKMWKVKSEEDPVALSGKIFKEFWSGEAAGKDAAAKAQFDKLREYFEKVNEGEEIIYPDIPITDPEIADYIKELDKETFKAHLERIAGAPLIPTIEAAIEQYCWSSLGASSTEVSAAAGLNFYASEFSDIVILPGGNAAVAERVLERLSAELPKKNLRTDSLVYDVKVVEDGVIVSYQDAGGTPRALHAKACVMACPKFIVGKTLADIEPERLEAIRKLKYHSYLVANVCINGGGTAPFYDLYMLGDGKVDTSNIQASAEKQKVTDVIYANYAKASNGSTVLTLYRGMPYASARAEILATSSYGKFQAEFKKQIEEAILPLLKIRKEDVVDLRLARWGHPLPLAAPGLIAEGTVDILRSPFKKKVFFVEQDNWALPAFETAVTEAQLWAPEIEAALEGEKQTEAPISAAAT